MSSMSRRVPLGIFHFFLRRYPFPMCSKTSFASTSSTVLSSHGHRSRRSHTTSAGGAISTLVYPTRLSSDAPKFSFSKFFLHPVFGLASSRPPDDQKRPNDYREYASPDITMRDP